jgi:hypothetical protein
MSTQASGKTAVSTTLLKKQIKALGVADAPTHTIVRTFRVKGKNKRVSASDVDRALGREPKKYYPNTNVQALTKNKAQLLAAVKRHLVEHPDLWLIDVTNEQLLEVIGWAVSEKSAIARVVTALKEAKDAKDIGPQPERF